MTTGNDLIGTDAARILAELSKVPESQPVAVLLTVDSQRPALTTAFLEAIERGLADPEKSFANEGMLFNYATYFLAKWREPNACPLFLRWFSLPGEAAIELGGDTVVQTGARFLASVCRADVDGIKALIANREASPINRGQGIKALAVLAAWNEQSRQEVEGYYLHLAKEGLERVAGPIWYDLVASCAALEAFSVFPELRRAYEQGLIDTNALPVEELQKVEQAPRGAIFQRFVEQHRPITDIVAETRWWAGFQSQPQSNAERLVGEPGQTYLAPPPVGRNDPCPCGSGKKFKKCCGS
jgi:hypothetical protein